MATDTNKIAGVRREVEHEEMDGLDIEPQTIVVLHPSERGNIIGYLLPPSYL